ncbi:MAG: energy-coupling factor transporter transmembrane component T [Anaerolineae bacterium]
MPTPAPSIALRQLDPRLKLITALLLIVGIVLTPDRALPAYPLLWALLASIAVAAGLDAGKLARRAVIALPFALAAITLLFTIPGQPVITIAGLTISDAGLLRFLSIVLKSWLALQVSLLLSLTTPFTELLAALTSLRLPSTLVLIISFMYRYLTTAKKKRIGCCGRGQRAALACQIAGAVAVYAGGRRWRAA